MRYMKPRPKFMQLPRSVLVGKNVLRRVNFVCDDLNLNGKCLVITGPNTYKIAGKKLCNILSKEHDIELEVINEASTSEVERIVRIVNKEGIKFIAGVGGGRVIDVAKLASKRTALEFLSIPTAASHDGIASSRASLKHNKWSVSKPARAPLGVIADTDIIQNAPYRLLASGCGDIISKYTAIKDWELSNKVNGEEISEYASALSLMTAKIIMDSSKLIRKKEEAGVRKVVKALISSGVAMSIAGSSRPGSGSEHKFSHALDTIAPSPALHGEQCGVGSIIMMYLHKSDWERIRTALRNIGAPTNAGELGIDGEYLINALVRAKDIRTSRYTILDEVNLTRKTAKETLKETGVIE